MRSTPCEYISTCTQKYNLETGIYMGIWVIIYLVKYWVKNPTRELRNLTGIYVDIHVSKYR